MPTKTGRETAAEKGERLERERAENEARATETARTQPEVVEGATPEPGPTVVQEERPPTEHVTEVTPEQMARMEAPPMPNVPVEDNAEKRDLPEAAYRRQELSVKAALDAQPKVRLRLYQVPPDSTDKQLPDEFVQVNGHGYLLKRGVDLEVPQTVYEILVQSGRY